MPASLGSRRFPPPWTVEDHNDANWHNDQKRDPGDDGTIGNANDRFSKRFDIATRSKEAACRDEPSPNESKAGQRPELTLIR